MVEGHGGRGVKGVKQAEREKTVISSCALTQELH